MKKCSLPTRKECLNIIKEHHVPSHILKHNLAVAKLAVFLAERLREKGVQVDVDLVHRACLLHDVLRVCDFKKSGYAGSQHDVTHQDKAKWGRLKAKYKDACHEDAAFALLKDRYPELALAIKKHRYAALLDDKDRPTSWEEKLVYYADKRVMHDRIVALKERLDEAHERHARSHGTTARSKADTVRVDHLIFELENEIFDKLGLDPLDVTDESIDSYKDAGQVNG